MRREGQANYNFTLYNNWFNFIFIAFACPWSNKLYFPIQKSNQRTNWKIVFLLQIKFESEVCKMRITNHSITFTIQPNFWPTVTQNLSGGKGWIVNSEHWAIDWFEHFRHLSLLKSVIYVICQRWQMTDRHSNIDMGV